MENKTCGECKNYLTVCDFVTPSSNAEGCSNFERKPKEKTVFQTITTSPEELAEKLVYLIVCEKDTRMRGWTSNVVQSVFETKAEAIATTVEKLKEVCDE